MFRIFTKEKRPQEIFNVNLTKQEVEENNIDIWIDHKDLNKDNYIVIYNDNFDYPIYIDGVIREMTREEKVANDIEVALSEGEIIRDKKIIVIPCPTNLYRPIWDGKEWEEGADANSLMDERVELIKKYRELKKEISMLKEEGDLDPEFASPKTIEKKEKELKEVRIKIIELKKAVESL